MFRTFTILLSVLGLSLAIYVVATAKQEIPAPPPAQPPSSNPYPEGIVSLGVVEPASRVIDAAAPEPGLVVSVEVQVNDRVKAGDVLFRLDSVPIESELVRAEAALEVARAEVHRLEQWPRAEDFPPAEAEVVEASERLADAQDRLVSLEDALKGGGASDDEARRQRFQVSVLRATLANAEARLARMRAGTWSEDIAVARAQVASREAEIRAIRLRVDRLTVRAPADGVVLKRNIEPGEFTGTQGGQAGGPPGNSEAPIVLGDLSGMHIRAQVDEEDLPLLREQAEAVARVRGPFNAALPLEMLRIEPLARPKNQITGSPTELIDTRVVEVVFKAKPESSTPRLYPGQIVDVFIRADRTAPENRPATPVSRAE